ncbi:hypothetical protein [Antribacter gilvus]|uniref:hypothetical protein n=1 Tax=Antribacter gilvus TaxID=2304675 RepID=UPI000F796481|nr:hypothetical protein [Antribacter gilvus]
MANEHLRRRRESSLSPSGSGQPMTRAELAEAVNRYVWTTTGQHCHLDVNTLARYERGQIRWPSAVYRDGLRAVLGVARDADLGFRPTPRGKTAAPLSNPDSWVAQGASGPHDAQVGDSASVMSTLRRELMSYAPELDRLTQDAPSGETMRLRVAAAFTAYQAGHFEGAAAQATEALQALHPGVDVRVRALAYQIAAIVLSKAGHADVAWIAADRGVLAAESGGDIRVRLSLLRTAAFAMAAGGHREDALISIDAAARDFERHMARSRASASVYGTLLLSGAVLSANHGDPGLATTYLDEAQRAADVAGSDRNDLWTAFGPTNVAIHHANVAAAFGDMDVVLSIGAPLPVEHLPIERQVRLHLDIARAGIATGDREDALTTLVRAEAIAPSQVRHHPITRKVVASLIEAPPRGRSLALSRLAALVGIGAA